MALEGLLVDLFGWRVVLDGVEVFMNGTGPTGNTGRGEGCSLMELMHG